MLVPASLPVVYFLINFHISVGNIGWTWKNRTCPKTEQTEPGTVKYTVNGDSFFVFWQFLIAFNFSYLTSFRHPLIISYDVFLLIVLSSLASWRYNDNILYMV